MAYLPNGKFDYKKSTYFCGQTNDNPNNGSTNFDNLFYALLIIF